MLDRSKLSQYWRIVFPAVVFFGIVYISWIYSFYLCWREIHQHHSKSTGIGLIVGNVIIILIIYFIWLQILILGPGKQPKVPLYRIIKSENNDGTIEPPEIFICNEQGYPPWCTSCKTIKIDRTHHSSHVHYCVAKMDHYCTLIGAVIGKKNYRLFIQFTGWFLGYFVYLGISTAVYSKDMKVRRGKTLNPNIIILFILALFWIVMLFCLLTSHLYYVFINRTTMEDMLPRKKRREKILDDIYISILYEGSRYVLLVSLKDRLKMWNQGTWENWNQVMGSNPIFWIFPFGTTIRDRRSVCENNYRTIVGNYEEQFSKTFKNSLYERVRVGEGTLIP